MMEHLRYEFILQADQPIAHHSENLGNISLAMRRKIRQPSGGFSNVPVITGDTMRHGMREAAAYATLDAAGLLNDGNLGEPALRLLFAGGIITGAQGGSVKLSDYRKMIDLLPFLALFGGCAQNRTIPGRLIVNDAVLVCTETAHLMPDWVPLWNESEGSPQMASCRSHIEEVTRVRMDPTLDPGKRQLLSSYAQDSAQERLMASEKASENGDAITKDREKSSMIPRSFETVVAGSLFYWAVNAICFSELDVDAFHVALLSFLALAYVGGKRGSGHGRISPIKAWKRHLPRPAQRIEPVDTQALGSSMGLIFRTHMADKGETLKAFLSTVKT